MDHQTIRGLLLGAAAIDTVFPITVLTLDAVTDIDPVARTLSLHALRPGVPWMAFAFLAHAFALEILAAGLRRLPPRPYAAPVMLRLAGGAAALLAIFRPDAPGTESTTGHLHEAMALVAFLGIAVAGLFAAGAQRREPAWGALWKFPFVASCILLGTLAGLGLTVLAAQLHEPIKGYYGLGERIVMVEIGLWMVSMAIQGSRVAGATAPPRLVA